MEDGCWNCMKWAEHYYWEHLEESSIHFVKIMDGDFSQRMELPLKFSKNFKVDLLEVVALKINSGNSWEVGLRKDHHRFYFEGGWKEFIEANKIEQDQTLMFQYSGDSSFLVEIFDQTGCINQATKESVDQNDNIMLDQTVTLGKEICEDYGLSCSKLGNGQRVGPSRTHKKKINYMELDSGSETSMSHESSQEIAKPLQPILSGKQGYSYQMHSGKAIRTYNL